MAWSYNLLGEPEQALLRRLSVFVGGFTLEAAEAVCAFGAGPGDTGGSGSPSPTSNPQPLSPDEVLDLLTSLVEKSLVLYEEPEAMGGGRYRLLETVRRYAAERLRQSGEDALVPARHREWFAGCAERIASLLDGPRRALAWMLMETEYANMRAALEHCPGDEQGREAAVRLLKALGPYWFFRGRIGEGRETLAAVRARIAVGRSTRASAQLALEAGLLARQQGAGVVAAALYEEALRHSRETGDQERVALALENLGYVALQAGDLAAARGWFEEALRTFRARGDAGGIAGALQSLGHVARFGGKHAEARALYEQALATGAGLPPGYRNPVGHALLNLGHLARLSGDFPLARARYEESLKRFSEAGDQGGVAFCLEGLACLAASGEQVARAARLFGAAEGLREEAEIPLPPVDRVGYEEAMTAARRALGEARFAAAWAAGRALPTDQAVIEAMDRESE
jgi:non-specific serine/threonine protein kinase